MIQLHTNLLISLLIFCSLNLSADQVQEPKNKDENEESVRGLFRQNGTQLSFEIISSLLPLNELWMHRVESISPRVTVRISDNGKRLLLNKEPNLPPVLKVKIRSYIVRKKDTGTNCESNSSNWNSQ